MTGLSLGLGLFGGRALAVDTPPAALEPSAGWDGTTASGFGGSYSAAPSDPTRTTAKPAVQMLTLPRQYFTDTLRVDAMAFANNSGTLIDGIEKLRFHFEGVTVDVTEPVLRTFTRFDGSSYRVPVYSVNLTKPTGVSSSTGAQLYIEAFPTDGTMQNRVIGPFVFFPSTVFGTGTLHDIELTVDPDLPESAGVNYQTFTAAHVYLQTQHSGGNSFKNPRITIAAPSPTGFYDITRGTFTTYAPQGWLTVEADVPVIFGKLGPLDDLQTMYEGTTPAQNGVGSRPGIGNVLMKGSNITLEMSNMIIYNDGIWAFDRVRIQNLAGIEKGIVKSYRQNSVTRSGSYMIDCLVEDLPSTFAGSPLARGNISRGTWFDLASDCTAFIANMSTDHSSEEWNIEIPSMTVQYTGAGATATISLGGNRDQNNRVLTAKVNGSTVGTITLTRPGTALTPANNEEVSDVVAFFNGLTDWTATLLDDTRRAVMLGLPGILHGFGDTDAKTAPLTFNTRADLHGDYYQTNNPAFYENILNYGNVVTKTAGQKLFLSPAFGPIADVYFINNAIADKFDGVGSEDPSILLSQLDRDNHSNVVIAHNSMTQQMSLRTAAGNYNPDAYCLIANNIFSQVAYDGAGTPDPDIVIADNHCFTGTVVPSGATGQVTSGDKDTLYADIDAGDFTPAGALLTNPKAPVFEYTFTGDVRVSPSPVGAGAAVAIAFAALPASVEPDPIAPTIIASSITGTPQDGEVLTANYTAIGYPNPTPAYQWQKNGTNISGQTAQTITLDASGMSLTDGDTISCEITVTNASGSDTDEPTATFVGTGALNDLIASGAVLAVYDWLTPGDMTAGDSGAVVQGDSDTIALVPNAKNPGTLDLAQATGSRQPVYNNGAIFDGTDDYLAVAFTAGAGPGRATLVYVVKTTDTSFVLGGCNSTSFFSGFAIDGDSASASGGRNPSGYRANGSAVSPNTRDDLHTAWATGSAVTAAIVDMDFQEGAISDIRNSYGTTSGYCTGNVMLVAILDAAHANYATALADAETFAGEIITGLGL